MSTWMDDLRKTNKPLAEAYAITGNQDKQSLRNMVKALEIGGGFFNTEDDEKRLKAAKFILKQGKR